MDHRKREKARMPPRRGNRAPEDHIRPGDRELFFSRAMSSVNQLIDVEAGVDTFGKKRDSTANMVWQNFLGVVHRL